MSIAHRALFVMTISALAVPGSGQVSAGYWVRVGGPPNNWAGQPDEFGDASMRNFVVLGTDAETAVPLDGPALYSVGGPWFGDGEDLDYYKVRKWDGATWTDLGDGLSGLGTGIWPRYGFEPIAAFRTYDSGEGPELYVGGWFHCADDITSTGITRWNGTEWRPVGRAVEPCPEGEELTGPVWCLEVFQNELYAGGLFRIIDGFYTNNPIARWNGENWSDCGAPDELGAVADVAALCATATTLYLGGNEIEIGGTPTLVVAWDGSGFTPLGGHALNSTVRAITTYDDGAGPELVIAGDIQEVVNPDQTTFFANNVARWNGTRWDSMGQGFDGEVNDLHVFDGELFAVGEFAASGAIPLCHVARWNPANDSWESVNGGFSNSAYALTHYDDGYGQSLFCGGSFVEGGGRVVYGVAQLTCTGILGDCNCDGDVDAFDISAYIVALTNPTGYVAAYPDCDRFCADVNLDGEVDNFDTAVFLQCVTNHGCTVPSYECP